MRAERTLDRNKGPGSPSGLGQRDSKQTPPLLWAHVSPSGNLLQEHKVQANWRATAKLHAQPVLLLFIQSVFPRLQEEVLAGEKPGPGGFRQEPSCWPLRCSAFHLKERKRRHHCQGVAWVRLQTRRLTGTPSPAPHLVRRLLGAGGHGSGQQKGWVTRSHHLTLEFQKPDLKVKVYRMPRGEDVSVELTADLTLIWESPWSSMKEPFKFSLSLQWFSQRSKRFKQSKF